MALGFSYLLLDAGTGHDFTLRGVFVSRAPVRGDGSVALRRSRLSASICLRMISRCSLVMPESVSGPRLAR